MTVNACTEATTYHKEKDYKGKLQGFLEDFQARFDDLLELKPCFALLVNPFDIDVVNDSCLVRQPFITDASTAE